MAAGGFLTRAFETMLKESGERSILICRKLFKLTKDNAMEMRKLNKRDASRASLDYVRNRNQRRLHVLHFCTNTLIPGLVKLPFHFEAWLRLFGTGKVFSVCVFFNGLKKRNARKGMK